MPGVTKYTLHTRCRNYEMRASVFARQPSAWGTQLLRHTRLDLHRIPEFPGQHQSINTSALQQENFWRVCQRFGERRSDSQSVCVAFVAKGYPRFVAMLYRLPRTMRRTVAGNHLPLLRVAMPSPFNVAAIASQLPPAACKSRIRFKTSCSPS